MITDIRVPLLSVNDATALLVERYVEDGAEVAAGRELCLIETSKVTQPLVAERSGYVRWCANAGQEIEVKGILGWIADSPEEQPALAPTASRQTGAAPIEATQNAKALAAELGIRLEELPRIHGIVREKDVQLFAANRLGRPTAQQPSAFPRQQGEYRLGPASGDRHRATAPIENGAIPETSIQERRPLSRAQRLIKDSVMKSLATHAHAYLSIEVRLAGLAAKLQELAGKSGFAIRFNDLVLDATAKALAEFPEFNASLDGDTLAIHKSIHLGMAVDVNGVLLIPVIRDAQAKSLPEIAKESALLQMKVSRNTLTPADCEGGTFTVTNLAAVGVETAIPIIFGDQVAILAVGAFRDEPGVVEVQRVRFGLSYDHQIHNGMGAGRFLQAIKTELGRLVDIHG